MQLDDYCACAGASHCMEDTIILDVSMGHVNPSAPHAGIVDRLLSVVPEEAWLNNRIFYIPPAFSPLAVVQATAIYALSEMWPDVIRIDDQGQDHLYHVAEICNVQAMRQIGAQL